jgi:hypothetical protein
MKLLERVEIWNESDGNGSARTVIEIRVEENTFPGWYDFKPLNKVGGLMLMKMWKSKSLVDAQIERWASDGHLIRFVDFRIGNPKPKVNPRVASPDEIHVLRKLFDF